METSWTRTDDTPRTDEFLAIVNDLWAGRRVSFTGEHLTVEEAMLTAPPDPIPSVYFGGSSKAAISVAARRADVYLTWGEPLEQVAEKLREVRDETAMVGREVRFGIRLHVIAGPRSEMAWAEAERLLESLDPERIASAQAGLATSESEGQRRMRALHRGSTADLEIAPNLWAGVGLVRGGAGTALVGSHEEVADRIVEYHALGIDEFIMSGYPNLEEAYWFGEGVLPLLAERGHWRHPQAQDAGLAAVAGSDRNRPIRSVASARPRTTSRGPHDHYSLGSLSQSPIRRHPVRLRPRTWWQWPKRSPPTWRRAPSAMTARVPTPPRTLLRSGPRGSATSPFQRSSEGPGPTLRRRRRSSRPWPRETRRRP